MNDLKIFNNKEFGEIRTLIIEGKFYAVGIDVAKALGYAKPSQAVIDHCKGIRKLGIPSEGGMQETNIVPEGDMYRLVVKAADQSRSEKMREKAQRFERWIFDEVLPSIRKTGKYEMENQIKHIPLTESPGEVARLINATARLMKRQSSEPYKVAENAKLICTQYGIQTIEDFVKVPEYVQMDLSDFVGGEK